MRTIKIFLPNILLLSCLFLMGCKAKQKEESTLSNTPVFVEVLDIATGQHNMTDIQYSSTIEANKQTNLSFQVSGTITSIPVEIGQFVQKGQLIAAIDPTTYRSQYDAQMAQVRLAKENYERMLTVYNKGSIAEIKMLNAKADYEQASAASKATFQNIAHTRIYAPQAGYVGSKNLEIGATAGPGTAVVTLFDLSTVNVFVPIPEGEISKYKKGDVAKVVVQALNNQLYTGRVSKIAVLASNGAPVYNVQVEVNNSDRSLKPGMSCSVSFNNVNISSTSANILVPEESVQVDETGTNFVYVTSPDGKKALRKNVQVGSLSNNGISITSGLQDGDKVVISGFHKITNGSLINIRK